jgi:hypothetical protein
MRVYVGVTDNQWFAFLSNHPVHGNRLHHLPINTADHPPKELLIWHNEKIFRN